MGFKKIDPKLTFAEIAFASSMEKNRSLDTLMNMNAVIDLVQNRKTPVKTNSPEGKLDKNGNPLKYHRDLESDWTVKNDVPHYGLKVHASVDVNNGFVLATMMTPASHHDSPYLPWCTIYSLHTDQNLEKVTRIKATSESQIAIFLPLIKLKTAS